MGYNFDDLKSEIKKKLDIVSVISEYLPHLKRQGHTYTTLCPFHKETKPSFSVDPKKQMFYCFGCKEGGDIFKFLMDIENISFVESLERLGEKAGVDTSRLYEGVEGALERKKKEKMRAALQKAADFYHNNLNAPQAKSYLEGRLISQDTAYEFNLGYATQSWDALFNYLKNDFEPELLEELGLIVKSRKVLESAGYDIKQSDDKYYDFFRNRIIFPIYEWNKIVGFGARAIDDEDFPIYMNIQDSSLFEKRRVLYGVNIAKMHIKENTVPLIVEGYFDVLNLHQNGLKNTIGTIGTSLTEEHVSLLNRLSPNSIICFDADEAGINAAVKSGKTLMKSGNLSKIMCLPYGDPDEFVNANGISEFKKHLDNSVSLFEFKLGQTLKEINPDESCDSKVSLLKEMIPFISSAPTQTQQYVYLKKLSETTGLGGKILVKAMSDFSAGRGIKKENIEGMLDEEELLQMIIKFPACINYVKNNISENHFSSETCKTVYNYLVSFNGNSVSKDFHLLEDGNGLFSKHTEKNIVDEIKEYGLKRNINIDEDELINFIAKASVLDSKQTNERLEILLSRVKNISERKEIAELQEKIRNSKNTNEISTFLDKYIEIENRKKEEK